MALDIKRKDKPQLTLIPEQERQIDYRFEFSVVASDARDFIESAVNSEMAEAFRPTAREEEKWGHVSSEHSQANGHAGEGGTTPGDPVTPTHDVVHSSSFKCPKGSEQNKFILYCPYSENSKGLARIRFTAVANFSDSLPLAKDRLAATNTAVIFLFWHAKDGEERDESKDRSPLEERMKDFMNRIAEINFLNEQFRPACVICGFEADEEQEAKLDEWAKKQRAKVWTNYKPDDGEDTIMETVQEVAEKMVERALEEIRGSAQLGGSYGDKKEDEPLITKKSKCCVLL